VVELENVGTVGLKSRILRARCQIAFSICQGIRVSGELVLSLDEIKYLCRFVGQLCKSCGCTEAGEYCIKASEAKDEEEWRKYCLEAQKRCKLSQSQQEKRQGYPYMIYT